MSLVNICVGVATMRHAWSAGFWRWLRPALMVIGHKSIQTAIYCALFGEQSLFSVFTLDQWHSEQQKPGYHTTAIVSDGHFIWLGCTRKAT